MYIYFYFPLTFNIFLSLYLKLQYDIVSKLSFWPSFLFISVFKMFCSWLYFIQHIHCFNPPSWETEILFLFFFHPIQSASVAYCSNKIFLLLCHQWPSVFHYKVLFLILIKLDSSLLFETFIIFPLGKTRFIRLLWHFDLIVSLLYLGHYSINFFFFSFHFYFYDSANL